LPAIVSSSQKVKNDVHSPNTIIVRRRFDPPVFVRDGDLTHK
jgi:hypothetical protein